MHVALSKQSIARGRTLLALVLAATILLLVACGPQQPLSVSELREMKKSPGASVQVNGIVKAGPLTGSIQILELQDDADPGTTVNVFLSQTAFAQLTKDVSGPALAGKRVTLTGKWERSLFKAYELAFRDAP